MLKLLENIIMAPTLRFILWKGIRDVVTILKNCKEGINEDAFLSFLPTFVKNLGVQMDGHGHGPNGHGPNGPWPLTMVHDHNIASQANLSSALRAWERASVASYQIKGLASLLRLALIASPLIVDIEISNNVTRNCCRESHMQATAASQETY